MSIPTFPPPDRAEHQEGFLHARDHIRLFWQRYVPPSPRATVIVLHGGGDHSGRYPAVVSALVREGFEAALVDLRGHGQSDGRRWYVDSFDDYVSDFDGFYEKLRQEHPDRPRFVVAHSQGALVAALWAMGRAHDVAGFVLSSPFFGFAIRPPLLKELGARVVGKIIPWLPIATGIGFDSLTSDEELQGWTARDHLYSRSTTPRWFVEARRAQVEALHRAREFRAPLLVLAAGADAIADLEATRRFVDAAGSAEKRLTVYAGFRHEIFNERERTHPIGDAIAWVSQHVVSARGELR
ncbi:MAG TPA: lysophospholipase [Anaeromyxobacteraceae bacterium]|nr:lysophospholipase [Anaeromyxobacteraceae bacterium]